MTPLGPSLPPIARWLTFRTYVVASSVVTATLALGAFSKASQKQRFQEIDVERINLIEPNGTLRMTISDAARSPGWVFRGKTYPGRPKGAGMIFFNDEGEEDGGIGFDGRTVNGKVSAYGGLAFDQYNQDETVTLAYSDNNGQRRNGLTVTDRADNLPIPVMIERRDRIRAMPAGAERDSAMRAFIENGGQPIAARRLFAGREASKSAVVSLADRQGRARLRMAVDSAGQASIQFLDADGHVTRTISARDAVTPTPR